MLANNKDTEAFIYKIFSYVLPVDFPSKGLDLTEDEAINQMIRSPLNDPQTFTMACYLEAVGIVDLQAAPLAAKMIEYAGLKSEHREKIKSEMIRVLRQSRSKPAELLRNPPASLVEAINTLVVMYFASNMQIVKLRELSLSDYKHPLESESARLSKLPVVSTAIAKAVDLVKRADEIVILADGIVVNNQSQPSLYSSYREVLDVLGYPSLIPLYMHGTGFELHLLGADQPAITVPSMVTTFFDLPEVSFLLGRQIGHVMAGHARFRACARYAIGTTDAISSATLNLLKLPLDLFLNAKFYGWMRASELTADRIGLLACQNTEAALRALMKLSGYPMRYASQINTAALIEQADHYLEKVANSNIDAQLAWLQNLGRDNNYVVVRAAELLKWIRSGDFNSILETKQEGIS